MSFIAYNPTAHISTYHVIEREWLTSAEALAYAQGGGEFTVAEVSKDVPRDVGHAPTGFFFNTADNSVVSSVAADTSAAAQRAEIEGIIVEEYYRFNRDRFHHADNASSRPIFGTISKRTQFLIACLPLNSSNSSLDLIKTEARKSLDDFAFYARMTNWAAAFDGGNFYAFEKGTTENSVVLPSASSGSQFQMRLRSPRSV